MLQYGKIFVLTPRRHFGRSCMSFKTCTLLFEPGSLRCSDETCVVKLNKSYTFASKSRKMRWWWKIVGSSHSCCTHTHKHRPSPFVLSLIGNVIYPKIRTPRGYCRWNNLGAGVVNAFQTGRSWYVGDRHWYSSRVAEDSANWVTWSLKVAGSFWLDAPPQQGLL